MKKIFILPFVLLLMLCHQGCEEFLEENPQSFASAESLFNSKSGIEQTLMGVYNAPRSFYAARYYLMMFCITGDGIHYRYSNSSRKELQNFTFSAQNGNLEFCWKYYSRGISRANLVLDYLPEDFDDPDFITRVRAESLFLRAWFYFGWVRAYGAVPLLTEYIGAEQFPSNTPIPEIYAQIIEDLKYAEQNLPAWQDVPEAEKGRVTRGAAKSLLAKVYLTKATSDAGESSDFSNAAAKAKEVINTEGYSLWDNYNDAFLPSSENGKEDIFSYQFEGGSISSAFHADFSPSPDIHGQSGYRNFRLTDDLYSSFEPGDERLDLVFYGEYHIEGDTTTYTTNDEAFMQKYRDPENKTRNDFGTNLPLLRYSDLLLIYAEAANEVNSSPPADALDALNAVRLRANINPLFNLSKEAFREAVRTERYHELYGEGHRWFDLVRWGILEERVEAVKADADVEWPKHKFFPIPQKEIDANENLIQNEGY